MNYKGRVVFITGGAGGIGESLGQLFLEKGCKVCLVDIQADEGKSVVQKLQDDFGKPNVLFAKCDVTSDKEFEDAYNFCEKELGKITILCNNAGVLRTDYRTSMDVNLGAVVRGTELAMKRMGKHNGGEGGFVVNTSSIGGVIPTEFFPIYCATKAAVIHYARCMGHEFHYNHSGVHVLSVCPGPTETNMANTESWRKGLFMTSYVEKAFDELIKKLQKIKPREVAEAVLQLIEEQKPGAALAVIPLGGKPFYVQPSVPNLSLKDMQSS